MSSGQASLHLAHRSGAKPVPARITPFTPCGNDVAPADVRQIGQCATLTVPEDRAQPNGKRITLPIIRIPAQAAATGTPLFVLNGGPGSSNLPGGIALKPIHDRHDVYFIGYRGADGSTILRCEEVNAAIETNPLGSPASARAMGRASRACARRLTAKGVNLARYTIFDVIDDLEAAADALALPKVSLISVSYGTRVAQYYARRHPQRIERSAMFGANPPGHFVFSAQVNDQVVDRLAQICAADAVCSGYTGNLKATIRAALTAGKRSGNARINDEATRLALFTMLYGRDSTLEFLRRAVLAESGDTGPIEEAETFVRSGTKGLIAGDLLAKGSIDVYRYKAMRRTFALSDRSIGSPMDQFYASLAAGWPLAKAPPEFLHAARDPTPTLIVNGDLDVSTPLVFIERELMPFLPNGQLVILRDYGHADFLRQDDAIGRMTAEFFRSGKVDRSLVAADPFKFPQP